MYEKRKFKKKTFRLKVCFILEFVVHAYSLPHFQAKKSDKTAFSYYSVSSIIFID